MKKTEEEPYEERRRREVLADIKRLEGEMQSLDLRLKLFRDRHFVTLNGQLCWRLADVAGRAQTDEALRKLIAERDTLLKNWAQILEEHARLAPRR